MKLMMVLTAAAALVLAECAQAKSVKVLKATPVPTPVLTTTYKLRTGQEVQMSESQKAIANHQARPNTPQEIARIAKSITVKIFAKIDDRDSTVGTGFFINSHQIQTVYHAVRGAADITVTDSKGVEHSATLWSWNPSADLAVINVADAESKSWAWFVTDSDWEQIGEKVYVYGNPLDVEGTFTDGMLSAVRKNGALFQISAPLDYGNSGSPVFNEYGLVIAIMDWKKTDTTAELNFAVTSNAIYEACEMKNSDHPNGFYLGVTEDLELRNPDQIDEDNAVLRASKTGRAIQAAFEQILEDVKQYSTDKVAAYSWIVTMRDRGPWSITNWMNDVIKKYPDPSAQVRMLADINALLKLQGHVLLSPSDDKIREQNEKALRRMQKSEASNERALKAARAAAPTPSQP